MFSIDLLEEIKKQDEIFVNQKVKDFGGTWCPGCKTNTTTGFRPFWHIYRRSLCDSCGKAYAKMLQGLEAYD